MSRVSSLEAEAARLRSINRELAGELREIEHSASRSLDQLEQCNREMQSSLQNSAQQLLDSQRKGLAAIELQAEIDRMYLRFKQMELANKKIRECNNKKYYDFANYRTVRKLVQGMMDNLDVNMVSDGVIYKTIEAQHLKSPDYWLTCVLLAIMAWKNDDRALAERAIDIALRLDKKRSAIFFMLFNLRMDRNDAALKWFYTYQECPLKGSDQRTFLLLFTLMNKTVNSSENLSDAARSEIRDFVDRVIQSNMNAAGYSREEMVAQIERHYVHLSTQTAAAYPLLEQHCEAFPALRTALQRARGNVEILEFLRQAIHTDVVARNSFVKDFVDQLAAEPNEQEEAVYQQIRYNELIIRYQGDVEQAKADCERTREHDETELNLIAEIIEWTFLHDDSQIDSQGRLSMLTLTKTLHEEAYDQYREAYCSVEKNVLPLTIGDYRTQADLSASEQQETSKITAFFEAKKAEGLSAIKNLGIILGAVLTAGAAVGAVATAMWGLLAVSVLGIGWALVTYFTNRAARGRLEAACANDVQATVQVYRRLQEEHGRYLTELAEFDHYAEQIREEFAQI